MSYESDFAALGGETTDIWNANADFWDARMGEGNEFHKILIEPTQLALLNLQPGERVLDIGCGNGQFARKMASLGANVIAIDASERMIANARRRTTADNGGARISYGVVDAGDEAAMLALGEGGFDAAVCTMALMDIAAIAPLAAAVKRLLTPRGRMAISVMHPCFNSTEGIIKVMEQDDRGGIRSKRLSVKITQYIRPHAHKGLAMPGQPLPQNYFHRPLSALLGAFFSAGFALDALEEPVFPESQPHAEPLSWLMYTDIPPVLSARLIPR